MRLVQSLRRVRPEAYDLVFAAGDPESREMAFALRAALNQAGWTCASTAEVAQPPVPMGVMTPHESPGVTALVAWGRQEGFDPDLRVMPRAARVRVIIGHQQ